MSPKPIIYLDNNASTRTDERVLTAMLPYFTDFYANANSSHLAGLSVDEAVGDSVWKIADLIGAREEEIILTSGATEAINLAIKGFSGQNRKHIITVATEHKAVLDTCQYMESIGFEVSYLPVNPDGLLNLKTLEQTITENTLMVIVMLVNNETGVIQNSREIAAIAHAKDAFFMCDATQAIGKISVDVKEMGIDILPLSAHKFYGPKGIGALYLSSKAKIKPAPQIHGGGQQRKLRSGTLNVPGIIGLGKACEIAQSEMKTDEERIGKLRDKLEKGLLLIEDTFVNGNTLNRIYNTSNICFPGVNAQKLIMALQNIAVADGSACSSVVTEPSHVLKAMQVSDDHALCSIRFSLGRFTTSEEIEETILRVKTLVQELKS